MNPWWEGVGERNEANRIDGRWVDGGDGKFVDVTVVHEDEGEEGRLFCRDGYGYRVGVEAV